MPLVCALGCQGAFGTGRLPDDPLFFRRDPIETKAKYSSPAPVAYAEPAAPVGPHGPVYANRRLPEVPGILMNRSRLLETDPDDD